MNGPHAEFIAYLRRSAHEMGPSHSFAVVVEAAATSLEDRWAEIDRLNALLAARGGLPGSSREGSERSQVLRDLDALSDRLEKEDREHDSVTAHRAASFIRGQEAKFEAFRADHREIVKAHQAENDRLKASLAYVTTPDDVQAERLERQKENPVV